MSEYTPPLPDAADLVFKGKPYVSPLPDAADLIFGADDDDAGDLILQTNFLIFVTM